MDIIKVDLRHSVWSADIEQWAEFAPGVLTQVQAQSDCRIISVPKRVDSNGRVDLSKSNGKWIARVCFRENWDDPGEIARSLNVSDVDWVEAMLPFNADGVGVEVRETVEHPSFDDLLKLIDDLETRLRRLSADEWRTVTRLCAARVSNA
jgi:hypothetical protein